MIKLNSKKRIMFALILISQILSITCTAQHESLDIVTSDPVVLDDMVSGIKHHLITKVGEDALSSILENSTNAISQLTWQKDVVKELTSNDLLFEELDILLKKIRSAEAGFYSYWLEQDESSKKSFNRFYYGNDKTKLGRFLSNLNGSEAMLALKNRMPLVNTVRAILKPFEILMWANLLHLTCYNYSLNRSIKRANHSKSIDIYYSFCGFSDSLQPAVEKQILGLQKAGFEISSDDRDFLETYHWKSSDIKLKPISYPKAYFLGTKDFICNTCIILRDFYPDGGFSNKLKEFYGSNIKGVPIQKLLFGFTKELYSGIVNEPGFFATIGAFCAVSAISVILWKKLIQKGFSNFSSHKNLLNKINEGIIPAAETTKAIAAISDLLRNSSLSDLLESMKELDKFLTVTKEENEDLHYLVNSLQSSTFNGEASYFSRIGKVLLTNKKMQELKGEFAAPLRAIGDLDLCLAIAKVVKHSPYRFS